CLFLAFVQPAGRKHRRQCELGNDLGGYPIGSDTKLRDSVGRGGPGSSAGFQTNWMLAELFCKSWTTACFFLEKTWSEELSERCRRLLCGLCAGKRIHGLAKWLGRAGRQESSARR